MTTGEPDEQLLRALGEEILRMNARRSTTYAGSELETSAFRLLWVLHESGPRTMRELSEELQLERSTINRQVNAAIRHGHLERIEEPGVKAPRVRPTVEGERAYLHDGRLRGAAYSRALAELGADRAAAMVASFKAFNDALDAVHAQQPGPPTS
ncbi:hypothetical protein GCM10027596_05800 [Nocardioides korecus]